MRERVLTTTFGAGDVFDAFVAAFRLPDLIFNLVVIGALSAAFIPLFTDKLVKGGKGNKQAFDFAAAVLNMMLILVGVFSLGYFLLADYLMPLIAPGFIGEKLELTVRLSRIMVWQPVLLAISFVFSGVLNSFKKFFVYSLAPILYNIGIIFGVVVLVPMMGVAGLGWGVVLGALLHMIVQLPSVLRTGFKWQPILGWSSRDMKKMGKMMVPRVVGLMAQQVNLLVVTIIGSGLVVGSVTAFHLANNVQYLPVGVFGLAFAQAAFPTMAELYSRGRKKEFVNTLTNAFRYILFFVVPISVFFLLLRSQIIRVLFGDGAFDWEDTFLTFETFTWLIVSIFAQASVPLLTRAFYVQQNVRTPVVIAVISMAVNVAGALWLAPALGVQGLAMAFSAAAIVNLVLLLATLHWQFGGFNDREVLSSLWRIALAAMIAGACVQGLKYPVAAVVDMQRFWGIAAQMLVAGAGGVVAYLLVSWMLRSKELVAIKKYLPKQLVPPAGTETTRFEGLLD